MRLDAKTVAGLDLGGKRDVIHFDDQLHGFGYRLRAGAGGKVLRSWVVQYRQAGASRRLLLGSAEVLGAEVARAAAKKALAKVALGGDPQAGRADRRVRDRLTFCAVVEEHLAAKEAEIRPRTFRELKRYLAGPHFKTLHGMPIDKVTKRDIAARLATLVRERGSIVAEQARGAISGFFAWCVRMGIVEANPVTGTIQPAGAPARERVLSDAELAAIWRACGDDDYGRIVKLLILLGCRRHEIGGMSWAELDLERATWTLPSGRSKNHRKHSLPLMPEALAIVRGIPHMAARAYLFGVHSQHGFYNWDRSKAHLDAASGVSGWRLHDVRRSVAIGLANIGVQPHVIEQILNHQSGHRAGIAATYNRSVYEREVKAALASWADHIRALVDGGERRILPLRA
jgi:integrase